MDEAELRAATNTALRSLDGATEQAIRDELATPFDLGHGGRLQFEVDPFTFAIRLTQTERNVAQDGTIYGALRPELEHAAEYAGLDVYAIMISEIFPWFANDGVQQAARYDIVRRTPSSMGDWISQGII